MVTETAIYGGKATVLFDKATHQYTIRTSTGTYCHPSVTTVLGAMGGDMTGLLRWSINQTADKILALAAGITPGTLDQAGLINLVDSARDAAQERKEESATIGSHVHDILEKILQKQDWAWPTLTRDTWMLPAIKRSVGAAEEFFAAHELEVLETEQVRWSPTHGFIGTGDVIARIDGQLSVLDYKTGKSPRYPKYAAQTAAYQIAYEEEHPGTTITSRWVVNVSSKTGGLSHMVRGPEHHDGDKQAFLSTLTLWRWQQALDRKRGYDGPTGAV